MARTSSIAPENLGPTITVGEILVEIMATTVGNGFNEVQGFTGPYPSGAPAIFIDQVAKFGGKAGIIGSVGDDAFGALNIDRLIADGVDTAAVTTDYERPTGSAFVRYREDGSRDFIFNIAHSAAGSIHFSDQAYRLLSEAGHLHIMGSAFAIPILAEHILKAARALKARGGSVSLDPNLRKELLSKGSVANHLDEALSLTDLLLPSGDELFLVSQQKDEKAAVEHLLARGVSEIVLKRGRDGATYFAPNSSPIHVQTFAVEECDPTGAGDCFGATYLTSRRLGMTVEQALTYANASGAHAVTRLGPMEGTATRLELDNFIVTHSRSRL